MALDFDIGTTMFGLECEFGPHLNREGKTDPLFCQTKTVGCWKSVHFVYCGAFKPVNAAWNYWRLYPAKKLKGSINFLMGKQSYISTTWLKPSFPIRSLGEEKEQTPLVETNGPLMLQEDLNYVLKLGACSIVGAAMIKYGSVLFPDIMRPNILQALIMISAPVIIFVFLLIKQTFDDSR